MSWRLSNDKISTITMTHVNLQYIPRNMHTVFALLCFVVVIHWLIFPYPSGLLHRHCGNLTIPPVPAKQPWWIWINTSCEFIMNDYITTTKQSTTKPCAYFFGYTVGISMMSQLYFLYLTQQGQEKRMSHVQMLFVILLIYETSICDAILEYICTINSEPASVNQVRSVAIAQLTKTRLAAQTHSRSNGTINGQMMMVSWFSVYQPL